MSRSSSTSSRSRDWLASSRRCGHCTGRTCPLPRGRCSGASTSSPEIRGLIADGAQLVTLTGPGGSGKTRLALQAAAELSEEFRDGVFFVPLVPLRESEAVRGAVAEAVGLQPDDDVTAWLTSRRTLLVLDNLEHLAGVDVATRDLLVGETVIVATSRTPLRLSGERELPLEPLTDDAAVELFVSRAAAAGRQVEADETVAAVCRRLDNLPLALELAAARAKLLSPAVLLQRLDAALPLLTGGASDRPEHQRTLRATIEWSYDLLDPEAKAAFRRLSVFRGSFTLDAAEAVTGADLDQVASLLEQSLLKPLGDDRFFLLETLREYARERLDEAGDTDDYTFRHAHYYLSRLEDDDQFVRSPRYAQLSWFVEEEDNLRAMFDRLLVAKPAEAARAAHRLWIYWNGRGAYLEARHRLGDVIDRDGLGHEVRAMLLEDLAGAEEMLENFEAAEDAARRAIAAAEAAARPDLLATALRESAWIVARRGQTNESVRLARRAVELAATLDDDTRYLTLHDLGSLLGEALRGAEAREIFEETMVLAHTLGGGFYVISVLIQIGFIDLHERRFEEARIGFASALDQNRKVGHYGADWLGRWGLGYALLGLGQRHAAQRTFAEALEFVLSRPQVIPNHLAIIASGVAHTTAPENLRAAARLRGAITALRARRSWHDDPRNLDVELFFDRALIAALDEKACTQEQATGAALSLEETIALARSLAGHGAGEVQPLTT